nr:uncharacterized protein LOC111428474 [Onthophagus taurus]
MTKNFLIHSISLVLFSFIVGLKSEVLADLRFTCNGRPAGYYADVDSGCQIYHMCDGLGRQFSYSCPNTTLFQQRMLICDHWYMVNCSTAENDYSANLLIGQKKPFVEDSESHPYHRTPRPDLLSQPTASEYNIVYRTGRENRLGGLNIVGLESNLESTVTDRPSYNLPSHWSTEIPRDSKRPIPVQAKIERIDLRPQGKSITFDRINSVNFIRPTKITDSFLKRKDDIIPVNFKSLFKNTTPVFPTKEELGITTPSSIDEILQPPPKSEENIIEDRFDKQLFVPNKNVLPPTQKEAVKIRKIPTLEQIKEMFSIPDYEFPLEPNGGPSYDGKINSFQANPFIIGVKPRQHAV